ncbi:hypothetical protein CGC45_00295 [Francisella opportunistica]|uniref:Uncharacterized protein n=1 Tax=Francisella opportunistica TaxID=2016517 RepID=A0A345JP91_9GAMM|nr:hypothetical protein BBG19_0058 [Francisella sp. MA067296]AXH29137.1 hypothetical protein CGC43_00295 [Francisella opportunistica]AXH30788.1 hypothetical protein CGC44_00295 [Francisella opportunistica]AXH32433.1 hypothetical protein CGC45_00295 [Francisella opportunistica]
MLVSSNLSIPIGYEIVKKDQSYFDKNPEKPYFCSLIAFCKLEMLKIKTSLNYFALKYKLIVKTNAIALKEVRKIKNQINFA